MKAKKIITYASDEHLTLIGAQWHLNMLVGKDRADMLAFARACMAQEAARWKELAEHAVADGVRRGLEGFDVRCTFSDDGRVVSWNFTPNHPTTLPGTSAVKRKCSLCDGTEKVYSAASGNTYECWACHPWWERRAEPTPKG